MKGRKKRKKENMNNKKNGPMQSETTKWPTKWPWEISSSNEPASCSHCSHRCHLIPSSSNAIQWIWDSSPASRASPKRIPPRPRSLALMLPFWPLRPTGPICILKHANHPDMQMSLLCTVRRLIGHAAADQTRRENVFLAIQIVSVNNQVSAGRYRSGCLNIPGIENRVKSDPILGSEMKP